MNHAERAEPLPLPGIKKQQEDVVMLKQEAVTMLLTDCRMLIAMLGAENEQLKARIAELEQELVACRNTPQAEIKKVAEKTRAATQARQGKALAEWQKAFKVMLPVLLQCQAEGEKARTRADLDRMCGDRKLTSAQMDFLRECLRECLGPEYVNTTGGPTIQG